MVLASPKSQAGLWKQLLSVGVECCWNFFLKLILLLPFQYLSTKKNENFLALSGNCVLCNNLKSLSKNVWFKLCSLIPVLVAS